MSAMVAPGASPTRRLTRYTVKCGAYSLASDTLSRRIAPVGFACSPESPEAMTSGGPLPTRR